MITRVLSWNCVENLVPVQSMNQVGQDLRAYEARHFLRDLETRLTTGLDPIGMFAVAETRERLSRISSPLGASMERVEDLTHRLFRKEPFRNGDLVDDFHPHELVWMIAARATREHPKLDAIGFLQDYWRVNKELEAAAVYPQLASEKALAGLLRRLIPKAAFVSRY